MWFLKPGVRFWINFAPIWGRALLPRHNTLTIVLMGTFSSSLSHSSSNQRNSLIKEWKKIELLELFLLLKTVKKQRDFAGNFLETSIQSIQRCLNPLFQYTHFLMFPLFQRYLNPNVRTKQCCLPPLFFKIFLKDTSFYISLRVLSLQNGCWIFSSLFIPSCVGNIFKSMVFTFLEIASNLGIFTHIPISHSRL